MFLGYKEKEFICNNIDCNIEEYYLSNFTGICKCKISTNFNYILSDEFNETNKMTYIEYQNFINEKSKINSFLIFKCGKESFILNNIKNNPGFYIAISILFIQFILFVIHIHIYLKTKDIIKKNIKLNPPKIIKFQIDDDLDENDDSNSNEQPENKNESVKDYKVTIYKNKELNPLNDNNDFEKEEKNSNNSLKDNHINNNITKIRLLNINKSKINMNTNNADKNFLQTNGNKIIFPQKGEQQEINNDNIFNDKKRSIKNLPSISKYITTSKVVEPETELIKENINLSPSIKKSKSFIEYYWEYLLLEQPIINLLEFKKCLKIKRSYIPLVVKLMRILFILSLNIFVNIFHLEQSYFRKKYNYFNDKYNLRYDFSNKNISLYERFNYGFRHSIISGLISFSICLIIQSIINFFFYNIREKTNKTNNPTTKNKFPKKKLISKKNNIEIKSSDDINNNRIIYVMENKYKNYLIFFGFMFLIMIFISYQLITFNEVYRGGISDLIPGVFWTFIFLQIIPFFYCFILAFINFKNIKIINCS